jgi:nucleoid-associated protein YgaU
MFVSSTLGRILLLVVAVLLLWALFAGETGAGGPERTYRVKPGDTLWSIAERTFAGDPREGVWELRRRNELGSSVMIVPGQVLVLPA